MHIILRDDDTSYFTTPEMLKAVYDPVWAAGVPVCLGVIPEHHAGIVIPANPPVTDPNIPPHFRGRDECFPITANPALCEFLSDKICDGLVEICLHGVTHDWKEFVSDDTTLIDGKIARGLDILKQAFPDYVVRTFIAPYNMISASALDRVFAAGLDATVPLQNLPPDLQTIGLARSVRLPNGRQLTTDYPYEPHAVAAGWFDHLPDYDAPNAVAVCMNHYHLYFEEWTGPRPHDFSKWRAYCDVLIGQYKDAVRTFQTIEES